MAGTRQVKTFAINQAWISAYSQGVAATWTEVPIVADSTIELSYQEEDVRDAEGNLDSIWYHSPDGMVTLRAKVWHMRVLELITGNAVSSYGAGAEAGGEGIYFGTECELSPPSVRLKMKVTGRDHANSDTRVDVFVFCFKASGPFPTINMAETTPGDVTHELRLLKATDDDAGNTIPEAYGRLVLGVPSSDGC